jgi:galactitol-specific phosphotransferase system IIB component
MMILSIRRAHIKNKVQRKLKKYGLPKEMAQIQAKKYKTMLKDYGSLRGLWSFSREIKKKSDNQNEELVNKKNDKKIIEPVNNHSSIS